MNRRLRLFILTLLAAVLAAGSETASAKDPSQTILWPDQGPSLVRFTFGKFKEVGSLGSERTYMVETTAENLWSKKIADASFTLYLFDKNKVRIGSALLSVSNVAPGEMIKFQTTVAASGPPVSLSVTANSLPKELAPMAPAKTISITVNTVPQGSVAKLDGQEFGTTPKMVRVTVGKHLLEFSKEGFNPGKFPFEIGRTMSPAAASASNSAHLHTTP